MEELFSFEAHLAIRTRLRSSAFAGGIGREESQQVAARYGRAAIGHAGRRTCLRNTAR